MHWKLFNLLFALTCVSLLAATTVQTQVSDNVVSLNDSFTYAVIIVIENADKSPNYTTPEFPENLPFTIVRQYQPQSRNSSQTTIINGKATSTRQDSIILPYQLKPKFEGQHQIPAMSLTVNGENFQTEPITISVEKVPAAPNEATFTAKFGSETVMLGDAVTLTYEIRIPLQSEARGELNAEPPVDFLQEHFTLADGANWTDEMNKWKQGQRNINGRPCRIYLLTLLLLPKQAGEIVLPPALLTYQVPDGRRTMARRRGPVFGSFFDDELSDPFGMFGRYRNVTVPTEEITLKVASLPTEGRPADFTGIVGSLKVQAKVSATDITVGEPILLDLVLSGASNLSAANLPSLTKLPDFTAHFKLSGDDPPITDGNQTTFQRTIRATTPGTLTLPSISFPYFDSKAKEYRTAATVPITFHVTGAKQITLEDAQGALPQTTAVPEVTTTTIAERTSGLAPDFPVEDLPRSPRLAPFSPAAQFRLPLLCLAIPLALWLLCLLGKLLQARRRATGSARATKGAKGTLLKTIAAIKDDDPQAAVKFSAALQAFFATRFNLPKGAVTFADAQEAALQNGFSQDQITPFRQIFDLCENAQFAGGAFNLALARTIIKDATKGF